MGDAAAAESGFTSLLTDSTGAGDAPTFSRAVRLKQIQSWVVLKRWKPLMAAVPSLRSELAAEDPAIAELDYAKGQALMGMGRLDEARSVFQAVLDARPGGELAARAQLMRGEAFFHEDRLHDALREFLRVNILYQAPRWQAAALLEAGKVYERLNQWADAAETYERLVSKFPKDRDAATARNRREEASRTGFGHGNRAFTASQGPEGRDLSMSSREITEPTDRPSTMTSDKGSRRPRPGGVPSVRRSRGSWGRRRTSPPSTMGMRSCREFSGSRRKFRGRRR